MTKETSSETRDRMACATLEGCPSGIAATSGLEFVVGATDSFPGDRPTASL